MPHSAGLEKEEGKGSSSDVVVHLGQVKETCAFAPYKKRLVSFLYICTYVSEVKGQRERKGR